MGLFGGDAPKIEAPATTPAPVVQDNSQQEELARQRRDLEAKRSGRRSLRIDPGTADTSDSGPGLRIE